MKITKEQFEAYLRVQASGRYNMFDPAAIRMSGLTKEDYMRVLEHYSALMKKWPELYAEYMG